MYLLNIWVVIFQQPNKLTYCNSIVGLVWVLNEHMEFRVKITSLKFDQIALQALLWYSYALSQLCWCRLPWPFTKIGMELNVMDVIRVFVPLFLLRTVFLFLQYFTCVHVRFNAIFLTNVRCILNGRNQITDKFGVSPPDIDTYLGNWAPL